MQISHNYMYMYVCVHLYVCVYPSRMSLHPLIPPASLG